MQLKELPKETSHTVHNNKDDDRKLQTGAQRIDGFTFVYTINTGEGIVKCTRWCFFF